MAHTPERPRLYVCTVHAGTVVEHTDSGHQHEAPEGCGACGEGGFTPLEEWTYRHD